MIQLPRLIGISGKSGCGKDTAANFLRTRFGFYQYRFAEPFKRALCAMFGFDYSVWESDEKDLPLPNVGVSPRVLAQTLGSDWGRNMISEDIWLNLLDTRWRMLQAAEDLPALVVSDVRFENEARWIVAKGGVVVRIDRDTGRRVPDHESERGVPPRYLHAIVRNDSDIITFLQGFRQALEHIALRNRVLVGMFE